MTLHGGKNSQTPLSTPIRSMNPQNNKATAVKDNEARTQKTTNEKSTGTGITSTDDGSSVDYSSIYSSGSNEDEDSESAVTEGPSAGGDTNTTTAPPEEVEEVRDVDSEFGTTSEERVVWDNQWEFLFSCISMSVGLGNVWRFPVTAFQNGGGAFLIPYFIVLLFIGRPIYFLELCISQFSSSAQVQIWRCAPLFKGVGYATMVASFSVLTYYCSILCLAVFYFVMSFRETLPWAKCDPTWIKQGHCEGNTLKGSNSSLTEAYFQNAVLKEYSSVDSGIGVPDWRLIPGLVFCWIFVYFSIVKGVKSSGKVAYFTAIFPYVALLILLIRGASLPGAWDGIKYFLTPQWGKLLTVQVWYAAVTQSFFSLSAGMGTIMMFASYNPFRHNIYRDSLIVSFADTFTSFLAGIITFSILGNLKLELKAKSIDDVVHSGTALVFVSYPDAIGKMQGVPQLFSVIFFLMLFTLGIGTATADAAAVVSVFCDKYPWMKQWIVTLVLCVIGFAVGLIYITPGGQFMVDLVDFFGAGFVIYTVSILEVVGVIWIYGLYNFLDDIEFMLGIRLGFYWKICWAINIPIFLTIILLYAFITGNLTHNGIPYPTIAIVCGWLVVFCAFLCVIIGAYQAIQKSKGPTFRSRFQISMKPRKDWGPRNHKDKADWLEFKKTRDKRTFWQRLKDRKGL